MANSVLCTKYGNWVYGRYRCVGNVLCLLEMQKNNGRNGEFDQEVVQ